MLSIIIPVYNGERYISKTLDSIICQDFNNFECIIIDDGSEDTTQLIVKQFIDKHKNIQYFYKENGGYVSARNFGFTKVDSKSEFVHFMDADDVLMKNFYSNLIPILIRNPTISGICSNHLLIDEKGQNIGKSNYSPFLIPTRFGIKSMELDLFKVPFVSIFCWAKIIEPMVVLRKSVYEKTLGWDERFGQGKGNIGDGVVLFGEIALEGEIWFLNKELYYYRKHPNQSTSDTILNKKAKEKVLYIWAERCKSGIITKKELRFSRLFFMTRAKMHILTGRIKHELRYSPLKFMGTIILVAWYYVKSTPLCFYNFKSLKRLF
jgi:glycosyltransferase involved in cell wall biosynthesis